MGGQGLQGLGLRILGLGTSFGSMIKENQFMDIICRLRPSQNKNAHTQLMLNYIKEDALNLHSIKF
jgi:hypothetical protein